MKLGDLLTSLPGVASLYAARRRVFSPAQCRRLVPELDLTGQTTPAGIAHLCDELDELDAVSLLDQSFYMRHQLLRDSDAMGMANSLEIRVPFLDNEFARAAWNAGREARDGKQLFARALGDLLPAGSVSRPKRGFTMPFRNWMSGPLRASVGGSIGGLPGVFDRQFAERLWRAFLAEPDVVGWSRPWSLFCLASYMDRHHLTD